MVCFPPVTYPVSFYFFTAFISVTAFFSFSYKLIYIPFLPFRFHIVSVSDLFFHHNWLKYYYLSKVSQLSSFYIRFLLAVVIISSMDPLNSSTFTSYNNKRREFPSIYAFNTSLMFKLLNVQRLYFIRTFLVLFTDFRVTFIFTIKISWWMPILVHEKTSKFGSTYTREMKIKYIWLIYIFPGEGYIVHDDFSWCVVFAVIILCCLAESLKCRTKFIASFLPNRYSPNSNGNFHFHFYGIDKQLRFLIKITCLVLRFETVFNSYIFIVLTVTKLYSIISSHF